MKYNYEDFLSLLPEFIAEWYKKEMEHKYKNYNFVIDIELSTYKLNLNNWINYIYWDLSLLKRNVWENIYNNNAVLILHIDTIKYIKKIPIPIQDFILITDKYRDIMGIIENLGITNIDFNKCNMELMVNSKIVLKNY
jgi:hypothetical protein